MGDTILQVKDLKTYFFTEAGVVKAVDGTSFVVNRGEPLGLVGESGSGKTVTALSILGVVPRPGKIISGSIEFNGENLVGKSAKELRTPTLVVAGENDHIIPGIATKRSKAWNGSTIWSSRRSRP